MIRNLLHTITNVPDTVLESENDLEGLPASELEKLYHKLKNTSSNISYKDYDTPKAVLSRNYLGKLNQALQKYYNPNDNKPKSSNSIERELYYKYRNSPNEKKQGRSGKIARTKPEILKGSYDIPPAGIKSHGAYKLSDRYKLFKRNADQRQAYQVVKHGKTYGNATVKNKGSYQTPEIGGMYLYGAKGQNLAPAIYRTLNNIHKGISSDSSSTSKDAQAVWKRLVRHHLAEPMRWRDDRPAKNYNGDQRYKMFYNNIAKNVNKLRKLNNENNKH